MPTALLSASIFTDTQFRMSILERLEQMEQRMAEISNQNPSSETMATKGSGVEGGGATDQQSQVMKIRVARVKAVMAKHKRVCDRPFFSLLRFLLIKILSRVVW